MRTLLYHGLIAICTLISLGSLYANLSDPTVAIEPTRFRVYSLSGAYLFSGTLIDATGTTYAFREVRDHKFIGRVQKWQQVKIPQSSTILVEIKEDVNGCFAPKGMSREREIAWAKENCR